MGDPVSHNIKVAYYYNKRCRNFVAGNKFNDVVQDTISKLIESGDPNLIFKQFFMFNDNSFEVTIRFINIHRINVEVEVLTHDECANRLIELTIEANESKDE